METEELVKWRENLRVHAEDIAVQHRRLNSLVADLCKADADGRPSKVVGGKFCDLVSYLELHFSDEEEFMKLGGYLADRLKEHKAKHQTFLATLEPLTAGMIAGTTTLNSHLIGYIERFLVDHERTEDADYLSFFKANDRI